MPGGSSMMTHGMDMRGEEPPDANSDPLTTSGGTASYSEWPFAVFVAGLFLLIAVRALVSS
jgi:hypothetical protein